MEYIDIAEMQTAFVNTYLKATGYPIFQEKTFFVNGEMQPEFIALLERNASLSHGEKLALAVAKELWTLESEVKIFDLVAVFSPQMLELTFSAYMAWRMGTKATQAWIAANQQKS